MCPPLSRLKSQDDEEYKQIAIEVGKRIKDMEDSLSKIRKVIVVASSMKEDDSHAEISEVNNKLTEIGDTTQKRITGWAAYKVVLKATLRDKEAALGSADDID